MLERLEEEKAALLERVEDEVMESVWDVSDVLLVDVCEVLVVFVMTLEEDKMLEVVELAAIEAGTVESRFPLVNHHLYVDP